MQKEEQISGECCWCKQTLSTTIYGIGSSYSETVPSGETFHEVPLPKSDRSIYGAILNKRSQAFTAGFHLMFATCSEACTQELNKALTLEKSRFPRRTPLNVDS
ncbi:MAG: hypothetical protein ABGX83_07905 [Nitrospira sp.]|nr:hypothetical protein [Candidatus Manganitrophaceae bacterium]HIL34118.1 hypothetical protein [Candidatus Manganitrophaceae bacterium]